MRDICEDVSPTMLLASSVQKKTELEHKKTELTCMVVHMQSVNMMTNIMRNTVAGYMVIQRLIVRISNITGNMRIPV